MKFDRHIGERHGNLVIITQSVKPANGYLYYYWTKCDCGNLKRYRYDQLRRVGNCGMCDDFKESEVLRALEVRNNGKNE